MPHEKKSIELLRRVRDDLHGMTSWLESGELDAVHSRARFCDEAIARVLSEVTVDASEGYNEEMKSLVAEIRQLGRANLEMIHKKIANTSQALQQLSTSKKALVNLQTVAVPETRTILDYKL